MVRKVSPGWVAALTLLAVLSFLPCRAASPDSSKLNVPADSASPKLSGEYYIIETRHRIFQDFLQVDTVKFGEPFLLGEEEDTARIIMFNPDLIIKLVNDTTSETIQASDTLYNPAVRIRVSKNKVLQESWAFFVGGAPHFHRNDFFGFKIRAFHVTDPKYITHSTGK
jgi:hypothetical protein